MKVWIQEHRILLWRAIRRGLQTAMSCFPHHSQVNNRGLYKLLCSFVGPSKVNYSYSWARSVYMIKTAFHNTGNCYNISWGSQLTRSSSLGSNFGLTSKKAFVQQHCSSPQRCQLNWPTGRDDKTLYVIFNVFKGHTCAAGRTHCRLAGVYMWPQQRDLPPQCFHRLTFTAAGPRILKSSRGTPPVAL